MLERRLFVIPFVVMLLASASAQQRGPVNTVAPAPDAACQAILDATNITIISYLGRAQDHLVAQHLTTGGVDNERRICAYPQQGVYVGPAGGQNDSVNWIEQNFACR